MGWEAAAALNGVIALCYVLISGLVFQGLVRTRQLSGNPLALATSAIFATCAMHHGHHAAHLVTTFGDPASAAHLLAVREVFGNWHTLAVDTLGAAVAITYLGLRRNYRALLNTPQMFDDAVRRAAEERLRDLAFSDILTGVPNRAAYQAFADELSRRDEDVAVLFIDLDGFKAVNDTFGHDTGDRILRGAAQRLSAALQDGEHVFRLGGDELVVVGVGHDEFAAGELVERVNDALAEPVVVRGGEVRLTGSIGLSCGRTGEGVDALLREADARMYVVKKQRAASVVPLPRVQEPGTQPV